jgi:hypothetical protein
VRGRSSHAAHAVGRSPCWHHALPLQRNSEHHAGQTSVGCVGRGGARGSSAPSTAIVITSSADSPSLQRMRPCGDSSAHFCVARCVTRSHSSLSRTCALLNHWRIVGSCERQAALIRAVGNRVGVRGSSHPMSTSTVIARTGGCRDGSGSTSLLGSRVVGRANPIASSPSSSRASLPTAAACGTASPSAGAPEAESACID